MSQKRVRSSVTSCTGNFTDNDCFQIPNSSSLVTESAGEKHYPQK